MVSYAADCAIDVAKSWKLMLSVAQWIQKQSTFLLAMESLCINLQDFTLKKIYRYYTFTVKIYDYIMVKIICVWWTYNQFHNILRLFDALPNFPFATSEIMGDYYL